MLLQCSLLELFSRPQMLLPLGVFRRFQALQCCSKYTEAGSHSSVKKTGVCASPSPFMSELLLHILLGKHPTVKTQALSSHRLECGSPSRGVQTFMSELIPPVQPLCESDAPRCKAMPFEGAWLLGDKRRPAGWQWSVGGFCRTLVTSETAESKDWLLLRGGAPMYSMPDETEEWVRLSQKEGVVAEERWEGEGIPGRGWGEKQAQWQRGRECCNSASQQSMWRVWNFIRKALESH